MQLKVAACYSRQCFFLGRWIYQVSPLCVSRRSLSLPQSLMWPRLIDSQYSSHFLPLEDTCMGYTVSVALANKLFRRATPTTNRCIPCTVSRTDDHFARVIRPRNLEINCQVFSRKSLASSDTISAPRGCKQTRFLNHKERTASCLNHEWNKLEEAKPSLSLLLHQLITATLHRLTTGAIVFCSPGQTGAVVTLASTIGLQSESYTREGERALHASRWQSLPSCSSSQRSPSSVSCLQSRSPEPESPASILRTLCSFHKGSVKQEWKFIRTRQTSGFPALASEDSIVHDLCMEYVLLVAMV